MKKRHVHLTSSVLTLKRCQSNCHNLVSLKQKKTLIFLLPLYFWQCFQWFVQCFFKIVSSQTSHSLSECIFSKWMYNVLWFANSFSPGHKLHWVEFSPTTNLWNFLHLRTWTSWSRDILLPSKTFWQNSQIFLAFSVGTIFRCDFSRELSKRYVFMRFLCDTMKYEKW